MLCGFIHFDKCFEQVENIRANAQMIETNEAKSIDRTNERLSNNVQCNHKHYENCLFDKYNGRAQLNRIANRVDSRVADRFHIVNIVKSMQMIIRLTFIYRRSGRKKEKWSATNVNHPITRIWCQLWAVI